MFSPISSESFYRKRYKSLNDALTYITSSSKKSADIVLLPPDVDEQTDQEDIDDNQCTTI